MNEACKKMSEMRRRKGSKRNRVTVGGRREEDERLGQLVRWTETGDWRLEYTEHYSEESRAQSIEKNGAKEGGRKEREERMHLNSDNYEGAREREKEREKKRPDRTRKGPSQTRSTQGRDASVTAVTAVRYCSKRECVESAVVVRREYFCTEYTG